MDTAFREINIIRWFIIGLTLFALGGTAGLAWSQAEGEKEKMRVEILVFSGRANPYYFMDQEQMVDKLKGMLDKAQPATRPKTDTVITSRLGYNGILIETNDKTTELPRLIGVYKNDIELQNEQVRFLIDDGSMERFLLQQAMEKKAIDQQILDFIRSDK